MTTPTRHRPRRLFGLVVTVVLGGCANESAWAPSPPHYDWPDEFSYRIEYVAKAMRDTQVVSRYEEARSLRFVVRDDRYWVWNDSVSKGSSLAGARPQGDSVIPADTLHYYVRLTRLGEFADVEPGCDPTVAACHDVPPSALPMELRRVIPRLPVWWPPKGQEWVDTLRFDDLPLPDAARGLVVTTYRDQRDTVLAGRGYWRVAWKSVRRAWRLSGGTMVADAAAEESGVVLVDKQRLVPAFAVWNGVVAAPPPLHAAGVTVTEFVGRAWLGGSPFDSRLVGR